MSTAPPCISSPRQLDALCRVRPYRARAVGGLSAHLSRRVYGYLLYRFPSAGSLPPSASWTTSRLSGLGGAGKTSVGWFFGFKLHLVCNHWGELLTVKLTPGNVDDRVPVPSFAKTLCGKLFGDKGYLSHPLQQQLYHHYDVELLTLRRQNMPKHDLPLSDRAWLLQRPIIETIIDQLKHISQIEQTRHCSPRNFLVNLLCGLIAYCHQPKKPSVQLDKLPLALRA